MLPPRRTARTLGVCLWVAVACFTGTWCAFLLRQRPSKESPAHRSVRPDPPAGAALSAAAMLDSGRPYMLYGTAWKAGDTARLVEEAVRAGFRFIDTACQPKHYDEALVGAGWAAAAAALGLKRSDIYLQTKFTPLLGQDPARVPYDVNAPLAEQVRGSVRTSLENLRTEYLDALVLHSPLSTYEKTMEVWRTFEEHVDAGQVRRLGLSNVYDLTTFRRVYEAARVKPALLQNRFYQDTHFDAELRRYCRDVGVGYQSFWTLTANRAALDTADARALAAAKGLTPQTLMYAFMMGQGHTPLSGTRSAVHMAEDVALVSRIQRGETVLTDVETAAVGKLLGVPAG